MTKHNSLAKQKLPIIVLAQFACTSLWFAGNAIVTDLMAEFNYAPGSMAHIISAVQFGFITGTLVFAIFNIADRHSPSKVFFVSACLATLSSLSILWLAASLPSLLLGRFATGFFLAGIYPVGMKIAADYHEKGLGKALGFLVGALVLGTAFPHLLKGLTASLPWQNVIMGTSLTAFLGGLIVILFVPDGPFLKSAAKADFSTAYQVFKNKSFRAAAFGYFGHMWEVYAFWAFVPVILAQYTGLHHITTLDVPWWSFIIIGIGGFSCVIGGYLSFSWGSGKIAYAALAVSGFCCLLSPLIFDMPASIFLAFMLFWGMAVIADSPQLSTLVAQSAATESKGTALTIVNSIGFAVTIISIQVLQLLSTVLPMRYIYMILVLGPIFGLISLHNSMNGKIKS